MTIDLEQLAERVEALENELAAEREQREKLEQKVAEQEERIEELEDRTPIEDVQKRVSILEGKVDTGQQAPESPDPAQESDPKAPPIWDVVRTPESNLKPTERRARFLWKDLNDYAHSAPVGKVLPASDARRVLNAAEPEESDATRISSKQVGRAFHLLQDLTRGACRIREKDGQRQLVVPTEWEAKARDAAPDTAVS